MSCVMFDILVFSHSFLIINHRIPTSPSQRGIYRSFVRGDFFRSFYIRNPSNLYHDYIYGKTLRGLHPRGKSISNCHVEEEDNSHHSDEA